MCQRTSWFCVYCLLCLAPTNANDVMHIFDTLDVNGDRIIDEKEWRQGANGILSGTACQTTCGVGFAQPDVNDDLGDRSTLLQLDASNHAREHQAESEADALESASTSAAARTEKYEASPTVAESACPTVTNCLSYGCIKCTAGFYLSPWFDGCKEGSPWGPGAWVKSNPASECQGFDGTSRELLHPIGSNSKSTLSQCQQSTLADSRCGFWLSYVGRMGQYRPDCPDCTSCRCVPRSSVCQPVYKGGWPRDQTRYPTDVYAYASRCYMYVCPTGWKKKIISYWLTNPSTDKCCEVGIDCSVKPPSANYKDVWDAGCAGAKYSNGDFAKEYCTNSNNSTGSIFRWYSQCCQWQWRCTPSNIKGCQWKCVEK